MNDSTTRQLSVGTWAIIIAALVLSLAAIMLHITKVLDHFEDRSSRYNVDTYQLQNQLNTTRAELSKLQADIAMANSFGQLKKSLGPAGLPATDILKSQAESPAEAVILMQQAQGRRSFDDYQAAHPNAGQKQLEEINQANRELKLAYTALATELEGRFALDEVAAILTENEFLRLTALLFTNNKQYEVLDTTLPTAEKATLKVRITTTQDVPVGEQSKEETKTVQMEAIKEGRSWKVSDDPEAQAHQKKVLNKVKEQAKQVRALQQQLQSDKIKTAEEFQKAWDALPLNKK